jgi:hypothetical protein
MVAPRACLPLYSDYIVVQNDTTRNVSLLNRLLLPPRPPRHHEYLVCNAQ